MELGFDLGQGQRLKWERRMGLAEVRLESGQLGLHVRWLGP